MRIASYPLSLRESVTPIQADCLEEYAKRVRGQVAPLAVIYKQREDLLEWSARLQATALLERLSSQTDSTREVGFSLLRWIGIEKSGDILTNPTQPKNKGM